MDNQSKGKFDSNFGFLMASLGSAVGLGNLWSFPYKMGANGGFAFLLVYVILCVIIGYPLVLSEIALGRKTQKAAIEAYDEADHRFRFNGVLQTIVPWFLIAFYCTFGGFITKFLILSLGDFTGKGALSNPDPSTNFVALIDPANVGSSVLWMTIFLVLTMVIVFGGVSGGIEKFCKIAMPALFVMLVIVVIKSCTMKGSGAGLAFLFKPNFAAFGENGFLNVLNTAGGQMFFSLSLSSGCLIAYGSYLDRGQNLEKDAAFITLGDSVVAILAGMAIMPAVFATGLEPGAGPGLLFITMTAVFHSMGAVGGFFQFMFWLLVFFAALSSSIGMMEAGIAAILDSQIKAGKKANRIKTTAIMALVAFFTNFLTVYDCLGGNPKTVWIWRWLGEGKSVLDLWDNIAEGILMPLTGLIMAILLGWVVPHFLDDEVAKKGPGEAQVFKSKNFYNFCIKWLGPIFLVFIVYGMIAPIIKGIIGA